MTAQPDTPELDEPTEERVMEPVEALGVALSVGPMHADTMGEAQAAAGPMLEHLETLGYTVRPLVEPAPVTSEAELFRGYSATLPDHALSIATPARLFVTARCPNCGELRRLILDVDTALTWDDQGQTLKLKTRTKPSAHVCGQSEWISAVEGQTTVDEALDESVDEEPADDDDQRTGYDDELPEGEVRVDVDDALAHLAGRE
jgi:hypothetical protein